MINNITGYDISKVDTVFLDLDGTVSKSGTSCKNGVKYMFDKIGYRKISETELNMFVGPTIKVHLREEYGFDEAQAAEAYVYYREYYDGIGIFESSMYDGIADAIEDMRASGKTVYIATLKPEDQAKQITEMYGITHLFAGIFGARHDLNIMHKQKVLDRAVQIIGETPRNAVMVGDRNHDVIAGHHIGFGTVGVLYGYGSFDELNDAGCDIIVDSVTDLSTLLGRKS
ncbi:MAG: HAD hydrolase-like protein [Clostridia bacterium]|jgi:phosphoglycolate phosphatase|nr:HAD hydrolase-like protein [Clostridia bacterium]MBT7122871.1 HAD hydrolase-like protein [Clostridia bacterium]